MPYQLHPTRADDPTQTLPRLRGISHAIAAVIAVVITGLFIWQTHTNPLRLTSLVVFGLSMVVLYSVSALYHMGDWKGRALARIRAMDHANIFLLIAGTYTPFVANLLSGPVRIVALSGIWIIGLAGVATTVLTLRLPRWVHPALYIGMGWIGVLLTPWMLQVLPWQGFATIVVGGLFYTAGGVIYLLKRPNLIPSFFGFHELFHLCTIAAGGAFVTAVWLWVVAA